MIAPSASRLGLALALLLGLAPGCSGESPAEAPAETRAAIPQALLSQAWQVRMAAPAVRAPFESSPGWGLLFNQKHDEALASFAAGGATGRGLARVHLEEAALYREAARLAANATLGVYGADRQAEDPAEVDYLLGVSSALLGKNDDARAALDKAAALKSPVAALAKPWLDWLAAGGVWPPDDALSGFPGQPGAVTPGTAPDLGALPHFQFTEQSEEARAVKAADPTSLYLLSRWHEAAARQASPEDAAVIDQLLAPWRLPPEQAPAAEVQPLDDAWLFDSYLLAPADAAFLAALRGSEGFAAVKGWADRSPLAAALAPAIEGEQLSTERVLDQSAWLGEQVQEAMRAAAGQEEIFHRSFSDLARVAVLRAGMYAAEAAGQDRDSGVLRINALDRSVGPAADPVFFLAVAAWDTGNRNPLRAQDLLHGLLTRFPAVEAARFPLDALHLRLGRNAAPATPVF